VRHTVTIDETGESYRCSHEENVLRGMEKLGRKGIPVGCRGGGCGVCKVEVIEGRYEAKVMSREHISEADEACGRVLACRIIPITNLRLRVLGQMRKMVCGGGATGKEDCGGAATDED
jgi:ferredoxin